MRQSNLNGYIERKLKDHKLYLLTENFNKRFSLINNIMIIKYLIFVNCSKLDHVYNNKNYKFNRVKNDHPEERFN